MSASSPPIPNESTPWRTGLWIALTVVYGTTVLTISTVFTSVSAAIVMLVVVPLLASLAFMILRAPVTVIACILLAAPFVPFPIVVMTAAGFPGVADASALKEVGMLLAAIVLFFKQSPKLRLPDFILFALLAAATVISIIHYNSDTVIGLKDDLAFVIPFFAGSMIELTPRWVKVALVAAALLAALGLLEVFLFGTGPRTLLMGLADANGLTSSFRADNFSGIRASSLLSGPLDFGVFCAAVILIFAAFYERIPKAYWLSVATTAAALVATLTRMAWLGLLLGLAVVAFKTRQMGKFIVTGIALLSLTALVIIPVMNLQDFIHANVRGEDTSTQVHIESISEKWAYVLSHPLGSGAGTVGPRAEGRTSVAEHVESGYLQFGMEYGWAGLILFTAACISILFAVLRNSSAFGIAAAAITVAMMVALTFSPVHMEFSLSWIWALLGYAVHHRYTTAFESYELQVAE